MYTAAVLTNISAQLLRWIMTARVDLEKEGFVLETAQGMSLPHHMTIALGKVKEGLHDHPIIGEKATLVVDRFVYDLDLGVCAAPISKALCRVSMEGHKVVPIPIHSTNAVPHITICIKPGVRPMVSNQMLENAHAYESTHTIVLDQKYHLEAMIQEVQ